MDPKFTWETEEAQVAKESVENLVESFFHAEQVRWFESSSPVRNNLSTGNGSCWSSSQTQDGNHCTKLDPGFRILRHGKNVKHIHAYFQNLEPHRYRLKLTAGNRVIDRPDSSMRVLQNDGSRTNQNPLNVDRVGATEQAVLNEKDWQLYEMVVQCYQAPYLSAPPVPSPYSPSSSPTSPSSPRQFEFSYSPPPRAQVHSPFRSKAFTFGSKNSPGSTPPANSTAMKELVRLSYGLKKQEHSARERRIKEKMLPKNSERVLVEDLMTQLYLLNNNCHPYYRIQSFLDKNGYDEWVTAEKEHITKLIEVFWHFPLPPCTSAYPLNQFDAHEGYGVLLRRFIRYESANKTSHSVFNDITPTAPLSAAACRILKEFGLRYGVGELYRKLVYLRYLVDHFECELWIIQHVAVLVEDVMRLVTVTPEIYVKEEFVMLLHVLTLLLRLSKYYLTRVTRLFPKNSPPGGVTSLVTMAELVQDASLYLRDKFPSVFTVMMMRGVVHEFLNNLVEEPFDTLLASYLKEEVEGRYERFKVIAAYKLEVDSYDPPLTPSLLNILIYDIQEEITIYKTYYQAEFERYMDFLEIASVTFYKLLMVDVQQMCVDAPAPGNKVDLRMLALAYRLSTLDRDMAKYLSLNMQTWREPLMELSLTWLDIVGQHLKRLIPSLLEKEPWRPVKITQDNITTSRTSLTSNVLKITSKEQLFTQSCNSAFRKVRSDSNPKPSRIMYESNTSLQSFTDYSESTLNSQVDQTPITVDNVKEQPNTDFKGKTIVTQAIVHARRRSETMSSAHGGLSKSVHIENLRIHADTDSDSDEGEDIGKIDQSQEYVDKDTDNVDKIVHEESSQSGKTGQTSSQTGMAIPSGQTSQTGISSETGLTSKTGMAGQTGNICQTEETSQTGLTSKAESSNLKITHISPTGKEDFEDPVCQTGLTGQTSPRSDEDQNQVISYCRTLVTDLVCSLTGHVTDQSDDRGTTPYENADDAGSATNSDYQTAESSPDTSNFEQTHRTDGISSTSTVASASNVAQSMSFDTTNVDKSEASFTSGADCISSTPNVAGASKVESRLSNVAEPQSFDTTNVDKSDVSSVLGADGIGSTSNVVVDVSNVESRLSNVEATSVDSKTPIPSIHRQTPPLVAQKNNNGIEDCNNCPGKFSKTVPDIEDALTKDTAKHFEPSDDEWNQAGPSGFQPIKITNKLLSKALEHDVTSEYGSVPSRVTVTSYETAPQYSSDRTSRLENSTSSSDSYHEYEDQNSEEVTQSVTEDSPKTELLPTSSSVVDLLCCINRLTSFACHLCTILCPDEGSEAATDGEDEGDRGESLRIKTALCGKLIQICKGLVLLYTDSLLAVETCGMTDSDLISIIGAVATRDLIDRCRRGGVAGCRLNPGRKVRCNMTDSRGKMVEQCTALDNVRKSITGCEPASSKMGVRNSDVIVIESLLSWLHDRITMNISCHKSMSMGFHGSGGGCPQLSNQSESYCQNGPSVDSRRQGPSRECQQRRNSESQILSQSIGESLDECSAHLDKALDIQCQLVANRINDLFVKILHQLINLSLPTFDTKKRLQPIIDFLHKRLTSLRKVMFPETFLMTLKHLWRHVVQDFTQEVELLKERRSDATEQSVLILNSMAYLMQFFHGYGHGLSYDELIQSTETVTKHIELYTAPSARLIRLYLWLYDQMLTVHTSQLRHADEFTSSVSTTMSHQSRAHAPADHLIQDIRSQLHAKRKCFSGADFVDWVRNYVRKHGYDSLGVCIGISDTETGIELGQYLLERNFLTCVTIPQVDAHVDSQDEEECFGKSRGTVLIKDSKSLSSKMRFNDISITKSSPHPPSSKSSSRPVSSMSEIQNNSYSSSMESEDADTRELLDSVDVILQQAGSNQSVAHFQHCPDVYYSFISDSEGSGGEFKYKLDFADRFSIRVKLEQIICVLFTRKKKDTEARLFLKRLPKDFIAQAIGYKETPWCFYI